MKEKTSKKILIVDDEVELCKIICNFLRGKGYEAFEVHNGKEALAAIEKVKPDLIILDVIMPVMDGLGLLQRLKNQPSYSQIPVIMLTVKSQPEDLNKGISLKVDFYLPKPFRLDNLVKFVDLILKDKDVYEDSI